MGGVGYYFLGYQFALLLGVITGILQLIPIFGPWPIYWGLAAYDIFVTGNIDTSVFLTQTDIHVLAYIFFSIKKSLPIA